jgi:ribosome-associated translation inhibitor RaiA
MRVHARTNNDAMNEYVERRLDFALGRMAHRVARASVRVQRQGADYRCRMLVELRNDGITREAPLRGQNGVRRAVSHRLLTVEAIASDAVGAVDHAVERASHRIVREYEKSRERSSERVVAHLLPDMADDDGFGMTG